MTEQIDEFFDIGGGAGAPSAKLSDLNDFVIGTVKDTFKRDFIPFGEEKPQVITDPKTGVQRNRQQMVVVLDTDLRNWQGLSKVPLVDPKDPSKGYKPESEDDGSRAVYIPELIKGAGHNGLIFAVSVAIQEAKLRGLAVGTTFKAAVVDLKDTGRGKPLKVFKVVLEAPAAGADIFANAAAQSAPSAAPQPPAAPAAPAAPAVDPFATAPAAPAQPAATQAPAAAPAPQVDPWSGQAAPAAPASAPPF